MKFRRLGKTDLSVSVIGIGTWQFGDEWGKNFQQDEVDRMFDVARELEYNLIDTAECYGDHKSESLIGGAIQRDRAKWIVATKFGHQFHSHMNRTDERSAKDVVRQIEDSLRALRTDYVDLYQYHSVPDAVFDDQDVRDALQKLKRQGKARHIGVSVVSNDNMHQAENCTAAGVEAVQLIYNRLDRAPEKRFFAACRKQDLGVLARVPLASGFLSGKYKPGAAFPPSDVRSGHDRKKIDETLRNVEKLSQIEVPQGVPMAQWALAWCLRHPAVSCVIPGCKNVEQVRANAAAAELV